MHIFFSHTYVLTIASALLLLSSAAEAYETKIADASQAPARQYTFAWKFMDGESMAPRGGTTKGLPIKLAAENGVEWQTLQNAKTDIEKDRAAILAMAGEFRTSFDFIEVAGFGSAFKPSAPYQSWGTEKIYVIEKTDSFISLQHVLVMSIIDKDGKVIGPMVTKHWRQDWQHAPSARISYLGPHRWQQQAIDVGAAKTMWLQTVYQVDDTPRYSGLGNWQHQGNYSSWISDEIKRPLPRREWSVRKDYELLFGTNRHTITPTGWIQEEQNNKLTDTGLSVAREFGLNRYERIAGTDFSKGDAYMQKSGLLWASVRAFWAAKLATEKPISLKAAPDQGMLFMPVFELAEAADGKAINEAAQRKLDVSLQDYLLIDKP
jgi:hypothetical protein